MKNRKQPRRKERYRDAKGYIDEMARRKDLADARKLTSGEPVESDASIDWLAVAIYNMGGIPGAARRMGVTEQTIYNWLTKGIAKIKVETLLAIAERGRVPGHALLDRRGPHREIDHAKR